MFDQQQGTDERVAKAMQRLWRQHRAMFGTTASTPPSPRPACGPKLQPAKKPLTASATKRPGEQRGHLLLVVDNT